MSSDPPLLDPTAVTFLSEPFTLIPVIHDILRSRYCPPSTILLVEGLEAVAVSSSGRWRTIRLLLGDGVLCVQALLGGDLHRFVHTGEVAVGAYIRCEMFRVKWRRTRRGPMVYLVVDDLVTVGWNESYRALRPAEPLVKALETIPEEPPTVIPPRNTTRPNPAQTQEDQDEQDAEEAFDAFETLTFPSRKPKPERPKKDLRPPSKSYPIALHRDWHDPQTPLKLTTLRSIPHLPYAQNWSCNVLAVLASLSPVEPSNLAPHKQRTARIVDPSTSKQVHLTVFLDPEEFSPRVGSAVLLVGVKNHRFDGGSLKKYASDSKQGKWWFEEPWDLTWCDVAGIKSWWAEMEKSMQGAGSGEVLGED